MSKAPVARRYAKALLEIGIERGTVEKLREQLEALAKAFKESREFRNTMLNPSIKLEERKEVMRQIAKRYMFDEMLKNFTLLLLDNERMRYVGDISEELGRLADLHAGRVRAHVTSAKPLGLIEQTQIKEQIQKLTSAKSIELSTSVDPALIGGVVTRVGGMVLDGSVRHQLDAMRDAILQEV